MLDRGGGADPFVNTEFKAKAVNFTAGDKLISRVSMESVQSPYPYRLMLPQSETERLLEERLGSLGVERQTELTKIQCSLDGFDAVLRHADGREESVSADWLIGCDGPTAHVRHGLNAPFAGETLESDWMLADIHMTGYPWHDNEASIYWHGMRLCYFSDLPQALSSSVGLAEYGSRATADTQPGAGSNAAHLAHGRTNHRVASRAALLLAVILLSPSSLLGQYLFKVNAA